MHRVLLLFCFLSPLLLTAQSIEKDTVYSVNTKDNYVIIIKKPKGYKSDGKYHHVYMTDGSIGIGDYVLGKSKDWEATIPQNCIVIAIAHLGDWHAKRARDLIPSDISKTSSKDFGKANLFYNFLKKELIPRIEKKLAKKDLRVFIGHSFGGLFCLYTLFQDDILFNRHYAISPSVWANYYELDKIEKAFYLSKKKLTANVTLYVGTLEFLNKVLSSTRSFYTTLIARKYTGLVITKDEIGYANHTSIRKPAIDRIFESLKK